MSLLDSWFRRAAVPTITAGEVVEKLEQGERYTVLDVREAFEWEAGHIPGATWIPMGELPQRLHELPKDREVVCVCRSGSRSAWATEFLTANGFRAKNLEGGMLHWSGAVENGEDPT